MLYTCSMTHNTKLYNFFHTILFFSLISLVRFLLTHFFINIPHLVFFLFLAKKRYLRNILLQKILCKSHLYTKIFSSIFSMRQTLLSR